MPLSPTKEDLEIILTHGTEAEKAEVRGLLDGWTPPLWLPFPGPQTLAYHSKADQLFYGGGAGGGKGLALDTPLPTPGGWLSMLEVQPGDTLYNEKGFPCQVTAVSEVNHRACYRITFDDGSVIVADDVHRWLTFDAKELKAFTRHDPAWRAKRRASRPSRATGLRSSLFTASITARNKAVPPKCKPSPVGTVRTTQEIADSLLALRGRRNHAIPVAGALHCHPVALPIDPYVLGAWLGDGTHYSGGLTGIDAGIWQEIEKAGYTVSHATNGKAHYIRGLKVQLRDLGVLRNKHVPSAYLRGSYDQRLSILQGLMDTDGHAALDGGCEFDNTNRVLVDAVHELAVSLGIKATIQPGKAKLNGRVISDKWRVKFTTKVPVFRLKRKLDRLQAEERRTQRFRYIVACEQIPSVPTKCIAVDSPSRLFLAGRSMVPTHNSDLLLGLAISAHRKSLVLRRESTQLTDIITRSTELLTGKADWNGQTRVWRNIPGDRRIEFGGCEHLEDRQKYKGRPHDLKGFDEGTDFLESQFDFICAWNRTAFAGQRCRIVLTGNPPSTAEGEWVIRRWAPWIDPTYHGIRAKPGELRWYARIDGKEEEVEDRTPIVHKGETITPYSRTFVPALVTDNPVLMATGYQQTLDMLPEPLRSMLKKGDFACSIQDDEWQVIPTAWVQAAMKRWTPEGRDTYLDALGVDVARGGKDKTCLAKRYGTWMAPIERHLGKTTPDGMHVLRLIMEALDDEAGVHHAITHIDATGVGSSPADLGRAEGLRINPVIFAAATSARDRAGMLRMRNMRAWLWWNMRDILDPDRGDDFALPPDQELLADLTAPRWKMTASGVQIEDKDDIRERIGRSPDAGEACILACCPMGLGKMETARLGPQKRLAMFGQ